MLHETSNVPIERVAEEWVKTFTRRIGRPPNELEGLEFVFYCQVRLLRTVREHLRGLLRQSHELRTRAAAAPKDLAIAAKSLEASARAVAWKAQALQRLAEAEATAREIVRALERERLAATVDAARPAGSSISHGGLAP